MSQEGTATADGDRIDAEVFGGAYSAELSADGKLLAWSDGDVWSFVAPRRVAAGRRKAAGAKPATSTTGAKPFPAFSLSNPAAVSRVTPLPEVKPALTPVSTFSFPKPASSPRAPVKTTPPS